MSVMIITQKVDARLQAMVEGEDYILIQSLSLRVVLFNLFVSSVIFDYCLCVLSTNNISSAQNNGLLQVIFPAHEWP